MNRFRLLNPLDWIRHGLCAVGWHGVCMRRPVYHSYEMLCTRCGKRWMKYE